MSRNKTFEGDLEDAKEMATICAENIIRAREHVTTQDLYDQGMLKEAFEEGHLPVLSTKYRTFADVIRNSCNYKNGYWEVQE